MLRLSQSNPRKKYEIDIKCDCEDPEKSGECMKDMTLSEQSIQAAEREQTEPTKLHRFAEPVFYRLCSGRDHHDQIPAGHPDIEKVRDPQSASARPMSRAGLIAGISTRGKFPMEGRQNLSSEGGTSSTLRRADQVFLEDVLDSSRGPSKLRE